MRMNRWPLVRAYARPYGHIAIGLALLLPGLAATWAWADWGGFVRLFADHNRTSHRQLIHLEQVFSNAFNSRDAATLDRLLAEDFLFTGEQGQVQNKAAYINSVVHDIRVISGNISEEIVRTYGDAGVVVARFDGEVIVDGQDFSDHFRFTDTWVKRFGRWYVIASQNSPIPQ